MHLCKVLDDIEKAAVRKGISKGENRAGSKERNREKKETKEKEPLRLFFSLVNDGLLKLEEAAKRANLSEPAFCSEMKKAGFSK